MKILCLQSIPAKQVVNNTDFSCRSKQQVGEVMLAFKGKVRQMLRHSEASSVVEYAYNDKAILSQRLMLTEELYGNTFQVFKVLELWAVGCLKTLFLNYIESSVWLLSIKMVITFSFFSVLNLSYLREGFGSKSREIRKYLGWNEADSHTDGTEVSYSQIRHVRVGWYDWNFKPQ